MPICAFTEQALMVMPDWSLVVTTFSRQSWLLLQRMATSVTSMVILWIPREIPQTCVCRVHAMIRRGPSFRYFTGVHSRGFERNRPQGRQQGMSGLFCRFVDLPLRRRLA